ncbi:MAG: LicD family protein [Paludibacteraceae bacterium]|nr:LicD family protein [Paludibacteraceae bacterium]
MNKSYTKKDIQGRILDIIKDIDVFCKANNITYYLMSGSALGAMRHKGFIPWDDDLDIFMTVDNYRKFLDLFGSYKSEKFFLQHEDTEEWPLYISRVCLKGTTMVSNEFKNNMKQHHNVFVDIICLFSAAPTKFGQWKQYMASQILRVNSLEKSHFCQKNPVKWLCQKLSLLIVTPKVKRCILKYIHKYEGTDSEWVGYYFGRVRFPKTNFLRSYLGSGSPRYVPFEDTELPVFENVEDYLLSRFGPKWMEMPDKKTLSKYPIHSDFVDLERDYTTYMSEDKKEWIYE